MPISVQCSACGKKLQAPDSSAGKRGKCPQCGSVFEIPEPIYEAEEVVKGIPEETPGVVPGGIEGFSMGPTAGFSDEEFDEAMYGIASNNMQDTPPASSEPPRRPCPACGEMIILGAAKCRFCGEIFDEVLKKKSKKKKYRRGGGDDDDLTTGDWLVAILCSGIGCIAGIVWMIQGKPKGGKMIGVSLAAAFMWNVIKFVLVALNQSP